jgi:hypothetical protein
VPRTVHRFHSVHNQIQDHLLQLNWTAHLEWRHVVCQIRVEHDLI